MLLLLFASVRLLEGRDLRDVEAGGCAFGSASLEPVTLQDGEGGAWGGVCKGVKRKGRRATKLYRRKWNRRVHSTNLGRLWAN